MFDDESTVKDRLPYKTGLEVCGGVVDRMSGKGIVTVTGKGYVTLSIRTGPDETGDRFQEFSVQPKQTCMIRDGAVVLYYKRRDPPPLPQTPSQHQVQHSEGANNSPSTGFASPFDIVIRVQIDSTGKFSPPFPKSVLRPKITTTEFFSWFASQSHHSPPSGPEYLKFTLKDAMPEPRATGIVRGNEDHFNYMRKDIKAQSEKAKEFMPELKEFVVLVTVPGWAPPDAEDNEEW